MFYFIFSLSHYIHTWHFISYNLHTASTLCLCNLQHLQSSQPNQVVPHGWFTTWYFHWVHLISHIPIPTMPAHTFATPPPTPLIFSSIPFVPLLFFWSNSYINLNPPIDTQYHKIPAQILMEQVCRFLSWMYIRTWVCLILWVCCLEIGFGDWGLSRNMRCVFSIGVCFLVIVYLFVILLCSLLLFSFCT